MSTTLSETGGRIHYGLNGGVAACGRAAIVITGDPRAVTCVRCQSSEDWLSAFEALLTIESLPEASESEPDVITAVRKALAGKSMVKWDGLAIDLQSVNAIVTVYDALKPENREKFAALSIDRMAHVAWKLIGGSQ